MLTVKGSAHMSTMRNIKGLHSCRTSTGLPMRHIGARCEYQEGVALSKRKTRRAWLAQKWGEHRYRSRVKKAG